MRLYLINLADGPWYVRFDKKENHDWVRNDALS